MEQNWKTALTVTKTIRATIVQELLASHNIISVIYDHKDHTISNIEGAIDIKVQAADFEKAQELLKDFNA